MKKLKSIKTIKRNSLCFWWKFKNPLIIIINFIVIEVSKFLPSLALKRILLKLIKMKIGKNVSIAANVQFDFFFPELIEIKDNSIIGFGCTLLTHEFLIKEFRKGKLIIGKNVLIGANSTILAGISIGNNSSVSAMSLVNKNIPNNSIAFGNPIKIQKKKN